MGVQTVLIKLTNRKKKLVLNTTLKLKVTARRKVTALNVKHRFIYILLHTYKLLLRLETLQEQYDFTFHPFPPYLQVQWHHQILADFSKISNTYEMGH